MDAASGPVTADSLAADLRALGVMHGGTLLVHSSMKSLGWVNGGPAAVIEALRRALGPGGTLALPAFSSDLSDPRHWENPPVPEAWWPVIRETMPPFDPATTPTNHIRILPQCFRSLPGVVRSAHPYGSFAALGPRARAICEPHALDHPFGDASPLARLCDGGAQVLLLGCGHRSNTSLHLAEHRARFPKEEIVTGAPVLVDGERRWVEIRDLDLEIADFETTGAAFPGARKGRVAQAACELFTMRDMVGFAIGWMEKNRGSGGATS